jgi:choline kinase
LKKYTKNLPKGMLKFAGKPLIERTINLFRKAGISEIIIVKGYAQEAINYPDIKYYTNDKYDSTNMLVSLFCAEESLAGDIVVYYADIVFEIELLDQMIASKDDIVVAVDTNWRHYWEMRYGIVDYDTESLCLDKNNRITSLGKASPPIEEIDARYIGLIKLSDIGIRQLKDVWQKYRDEFWYKSWQVSGEPLSNAYITDMLMALIDENYCVTALKTRNGWIEFDTNEDYENALKWHKNGELESILKID